MYTVLVSPQLENGDKIKDEEKEIEESKQGDVFFVVVVVVSLFLFSCERLHTRTHNVSSLVEKWVVDVKELTLKEKKEANAATTQ